LPPVVDVFRSCVSLAHVISLRNFSSYDPGYTNTAVCTSAICEIKGSKGELSYRGYDIIELVNNSTFVEVAYLLIHGKLPDKVRSRSNQTHFSRFACC
jgi:citrate synthase